MPAPIYRLETFGKLTLRGPAGTISPQRRRLALFALLASSSERGMSRDQLMSYLWSESSAENARHSLEQLLHSVRRAFTEPVFAGTNPVCLESGLVSSDVAEFEAALAGNALADAVALYGGAFLQGFFLNDAPEFERWTSSERARLAGRYNDALDRLASEAESAGHHTAEVHWRRRAVEADPVSSRAALRLMKSLAASGDRTAALQHARVYETLVRQELESEPDPSISAFVDALKSGAVSEPVASALASRDVPPAIGESHLEAHAPSGPHDAEAVTELVAPRPARPSRKGLIAVLALGVVLVSVATWRYSRSERVPAADANRIVIVPFRINATDSSMRNLGEGVVDLIAPMMSGEGGPLAVDSRTAISTWNRVTRGHEGTGADARRVARELGAALSLTGSIVESRGMLTISGRVTADDARARSLTSVTGPADSLSGLLDRFVAQLLVRESSVPDVSLSSVMSHSLSAIRAYLSGRAAYRRDDEEEAVTQFSRALDIDSTFALAGVELAVATERLLRLQICRNEQCRIFSALPGFASSGVSADAFDRAVRLAWNNRSRLTTRDLALLKALRGPHYPRESSARQTLAGLGEAVRMAPDRAETHYLLGTLLLYQGPALGLSNSRVDAASAFRKASRLDPAYLAPLARMAELAAFEGDAAGVRDAATNYLERDSAGPTADYVRWLLAAATGDNVRQLAIRKRLRAMSVLTLEHIRLTSQMTGLALEDADSASAMVIEFSTEPVEKSAAFRRSQLLTLNRGRPAKADELLHRMVELRAHGYTYMQFAMAGALYGDGDPVAADNAARELRHLLARDTVGELPPDAVRRISVAIVLQSLWDLSTGDTTAAVASASWLKGRLQGQSRNRALVVLPGMLIASAGHRSEAAALRSLVDSISREGCCELPDFVLLVLAHAYELSGDPESALRTIRRGVWYDPSRNLSTYLREEGRLAALTGDRPGALRAYRRYLKLRSDPEPVLRAQRDSVIREVQRLAHLR